MTPSPLIRTLVRAVCLLSTLSPLFGYRDLARCCGCGSRLWRQRTDTESRFDMGGIMLYRLTVTRLFAIWLCVTVCLVAQPPVYRPFGFGFSPYTDGQNPNQNIQISPSQIQQRMAIVAPFTNWIRTFGCTHGLDQAGPIAHNMGLNSAIGIWIGKDFAANDREIACGVASALNGYADMIIVGSEVLLRGDVSEQQLLAYLQTVRQQIPSNL